jgi:hypothetical protein
MCQRFFESEDQARDHETMRLIANSSGYESDLNELGCRCHLPRRAPQPPPPLPSTIVWSGEWEGGL